MPGKSKGSSLSAKIARPRPQTLSTTVETRRRRPLIPGPVFTLKLGDTIGEDLTVIGHLNRGRISEIYQAWSIFFTCALTCKILLPGFGPQSREVRDFKREAMLLRRLEHPQIVRIFHQGSFDGRDYLVQEYLHGPSLFELIKHSPNRQIPTPDAIKAAIHVCSALDHLHAQGYVYRDMKPSNIILRGGIPILVDFDAAYRLKRNRRPGRRIGTDPYMAPEQCLMEEVYPSTDVYGLGAILYEMLTGRWPYEEELLAPNKKKTLRGRYPQIGDVPPPAPTRFNPKISDAVSEVVLRCLEKKPAGRFQTARELIRKLATLLDGKDQMWPESLDLRNRVA